MILRYAAEALVFLDESVNSVDDGFYYILLGANVPQWVNCPAARHSRGATLSFADGHSERWNWRGITTDLAPNAPVVGSQRRDLQRLQDAIGQ